MAFLIFKVLSLSLTLFLSLTAYEQQIPTIHISPVDEILDIGDAVQLECTVQNAKDYPVVWVKYDKVINESIILSVGPSLVTRDSRFSIKVDDTSNTYKFSIKDFQESDLGSYQCQVILSVVNKVFEKVDLQIRKPPIIFNSTSPFTTKLGESVQLECHAGGHPVPTIHWRREYNVLLSATGEPTYRGSVLKIPSVKREDAGEYYCVAENGVGKGVRKAIYLGVEFPPIVTVPRARIWQALKYDADLACQVEGHPPPAIVWSKDDVQLPNNNHYSVSAFATDNAITTIILRILSIDEHQYGQYKCKAHNKLGSATGLVELIETDAPVCPPACTTTTEAPTTETRNTTIDLKTLILLTTA